MFVARLAAVARGGLTFFQFVSVEKPDRVLNAAKTGPRRGLDFTGSTSPAPDIFIVARDVIAVINYINAKGSANIPANTPYGPSYFDAAGDNNVVARDVIKIIN